MSDNFNEENNNQEPKKHWMDGNDKTLKFLTVCLCAFLGGFLAVLTLSCFMTLSHKHARPFRPMNPAARENTVIADEIFNDMRADFDVPPAMPPKRPLANRIVRVEENADAYKIYIDLKKFNNDENNVKIDIKPQFVKISGNSEINDKNEQSSFSYVKEFNLSRKVDVDDISKERVGNKYIITLPVED